MRYSLIFSEQAKDDIARLKHSEPIAFKKVCKLLEEIAEHPKYGSGKPEMLKGDKYGQWSRRISQKHRLFYEIIENKVLIYILTAYGHYSDK